MHSRAQTCTHAHEIRKQHTRGPSNECVHATFDFQKAVTVRENVFKIDFVELFIT